MTYTGAWLRNAYTDTDAAKVPIADPAHGITDDPGTAPYVHEAPPLTEVGPIGAYPGSEWVVCTPGTVLDHTDYDSHEGDAGNAGAARQGYYAQPPTQFADEHYVGIRFPSLPGQQVNPTALKRGLNSLPENNPDGFEVGQEQVNTFWVDRPFAVGKRVHDRRVVTPNLAYAPENVPAPVNGNPYTAVFDSQAKALQRVFQRPQLRREPQSISADVVSEPIEERAAPVLSTWVVG